jgi:3-(3-hydroxy-phenyl)propionate hydroxylase
MQRVLIAGAGPVGMVSALALARAGIPVLVLERNADLAEDLRGTTFHPPTLDMLGGLELAGDLSRLGLVARATQYRDRREGLIAEFDMELLRGETDHPYRLQCEQFKLTRLAAEQLRGYPHAEIRFRTAITGVAQTAEGVTVSVNSGGSREEWAGSYLIGADGVRSTVRQAIGIDFEGFTYPERFFVAATTFDFSRHFDRLSYINYISDPDDWCALVQVPGSWRALFPTRAEETDAEVLTEGYADARLQRLAPKPEPYETVHRTLYRVHQRVAKRFRLDRVFLAGDAAHANNPLGGMGMNGGLHDAVNLCDKLVKVHRGDALEDTLDRYERQRRSIAIYHINASTARNKKLIEERDDATRRQNHEEMRRTAADPARTRSFLRKISMMEALRASEQIQ